MIGAGEGGSDGGGRRRVEVAGMLMRMALALLDKAGESLAAARLSEAIDVLPARPASSIGPGASWRPPTETD